VAENNEMTPDKAKEILVKEKKTKEDKCNAEMQALLKKYNCAIDVSVLIKQNQIIPIVSIQAK
jgi:hypothetical protein